MAQEIERKFLVRDDSWRNTADAGKRYLQGYLCLEKGRVVRIRVKEEETEAYLTIKGARQGISAPEYEYPIPLADAREMLEQLCLRPLIEKVRYRVEHGGLVWEVDEFLGENQGLVLAEVELEAAEQEVAVPGWAGREVSDDGRYSNASLVQHPFSGWG